VPNECRLEPFAEGAREGPSRIRTGDGGFAIRCRNFPSLGKPNQLGRDPSGEVPTEVPSPNAVRAAHQIPADLASVASAWDHLPEPIKAEILALVRAAGGSRG
jgi:hypothetical protein